MPNIFLWDWLNNYYLRRDPEQAPLQVAWLSLDSNDNDPARFLTYFVGALQKVDVILADEVLPVIQAFQISSIKEIWELLAGQIASIPSPFVLVLDDYHLIEAPIIHESISLMLEQMPPGMIWWSPPAWIHPFPCQDSGFEAN